MTPNLSTIMFYYQTKVINLEASFLGTTRVIGWIGLMVGTFICNRFLKKMKLRRILILHMLLCVLANSSRYSCFVGIPDKSIMLFGFAISDAINQFNCDNLLQ
ncbi:putative MFS transporter superfamily, biopterin transporter family [Helianthus annuus]|nr:putative MFS transporter superfamily, biopterin transporter family [Helianthus annuus]